MRTFGGLNVVKLPAVRSDEDLASEVRLTLGLVQVLCQELSNRGYTVRGGFSDDEVLDITTLESIEFVRGDKVI